jgi:hypothetical protein
VRGVPCADRDNASLLGLLLQLGASLPVTSTYASGVRHPLVPSVEVRLAPVLKGSPDMSSVNSTFTQPVATRLRPVEYDRLRAVASAQGTTVSALLARLARRELQAA